MSNPNITNDSTCSDAQDNDTTYVSKDDFVYLTKNLYYVNSTDNENGETHHTIPIGKVQDEDIILEICQNDKVECSEVTRLLQPKV